jgi:histidinol dehydrogenase
MMLVYNFPAQKQWTAICKRPVADAAQLQKTVSRILQQVKQDGDKAITALTLQIDKVALKSIKVTDAEIKKAAATLSPALQKAIRQAAANIKKFHATQLVTQPEIIETMPGIQCWRESIGIEKVGLYIPGGSAPLFSTVLMLAIPAKLAGCKEIVLCTPPSKEGKIHPAILYAASICGVTKIFKVGGAQAIAAMAYGTKQVPKVFKIFGPGNQYVTAAKQMVQLENTAIDMPAGPSEVLVIADKTANPYFVAADLLSQAEHGPDSQVMVVVTKEVNPDTIKQAITDQLVTLPRQTIAQKALDNSKIVVVNNLDEAIAFSNYYAPEHLILACDQATKLAKKVTAAGSVFIGHYSPESVGDYASGTNHTLPTNGFAAMYSGVSVDSFVKKITYQQLTQQGLQKIGKTVMTMAQAEGLDAHSNAVAIRL